MTITSHRLRLTAAIVLSALALALSLGLPFLLEDAGEPLDATTQIRTESPAPPSPATDDAVAAPLDGAAFGTIVAAYVAPAEVVFDARELLLGAEARAAAASDGREAFDHYLRDTGGPRRSLPVSDDVVVTRVACDDGGCVEGQEQTYDAFTRSFDDQADGVDHRSFDLTIDDGVVVRIDERYFP